MEPLDRYIRDALYTDPALADTGGKIGLALAGSRAVGYDVPSSDCDLLGVCDGETFARIRERAGRAPSVKGVHILVDREEVQRRFGIEVDLDIYPASRVRDAIRAYNDVVLWIWTHAQVIVDPEHAIAGLKG